MTLFNTEADRFLRAIIETPTPSGFEEGGQTLFESYAKEHVDSITTDTLGNVIAFKKSQYKNSPKLMISAHMDEIGFMVKYIDEKGMVYVRPIGGVDLSLLPGLPLNLQHADEKYIAVAGRKPIHLLSGSERKNVDTDSVWLDFGFNSKEEALSSISIGDRITYSANLRVMQNERVAIHSADNKIGCMILLEVMKNLTTSAYDIYFVSTVQEEIGLRGSTVAGLRIEPDIALVIDAAHATDYPLGNPTKHGDIGLGKGPVLCVSPDTDRLISEKLRLIANTCNIKYQMEGHPNGTSTEARSLQVAGKGVRTALISFPVRYMHSPLEVFAIEDIQQTIRLITEFCSTEIHRQ